MIDRKLSITLLPMPSTIKLKEYYPLIMVKLNWLLDNPRVKLMFVILTV